MTEGLDMSLDDIIKNNKKSGGSDANTSHTHSHRGGGGGGGHGRGRSRSHGNHGHGYGHGRGLEFGPGPARRFGNRVTTRTNPYFVPQAFHMQEMMVGGELNSEAGTKLYISNLDYGVTNEDIKVLFSDVGELKRYSVHYDRSGRSKGTAEVVYMRQPDAVAAMKRYNNVMLDGKPMKLELVGVNIFTPVPVSPMQKGILGNPINASSRSMQGRIVGRGQERGGNVNGNGHRGSWSGKSRGQPQKPSAEDLDADLEKYRLQALHIN